MAPTKIRSKPFRKMSHNRYWWYRLKDSDYIPPVFGWLTDAEWKIMKDWFLDTEKNFTSPGEVSIPGISFLFGMVSGNGISAMVQCGHYVGYSSLLLGFLFRRMGKKKALFSIDIDKHSSDYTQDWLNRAGLNDYVTLVLGSSSDPSMPNQARTQFGRDPQFVFIDSSHQYHHTLEELDLWWPALQPGGLIVMHDVSVFAQTFDATKKGGVMPAVKDWSKNNGVSCFLINSFVEAGMDPNDLTYKDGCGIGLIQKGL